MDYPARFVPDGAAAEALRAKARDRIRELHPDHRTHDNPRTVSFVLWIFHSGHLRGHVHPAGAWSRNGSVPTCPSADGVGTSRVQHGERPAITPLWRRHFDWQ